MAKVLSTLYSNTSVAEIRPEIRFIFPQHDSIGDEGTYEAIELTEKLEGYGISCCLVGTSALVFYGAERMHHDWEICIPSANIGDVVSLLSSDSFSSIYSRVQHQLEPQPASLAHTYPRFRRNGSNTHFMLVPSHDTHIQFSTATFQCSSSGLRYPTLAVLIQSFIDTNNDVALCDIIDGTNVSEEWGKEHLDLNGTNDVSWAHHMNEKIRDPTSFVSLFPTEIIDKRKLWESRVRSKTDRLGWTRPKELFDTRFRLKGSKDPWTCHDDDGRDGGKLRAT